MHPLIGYVLKAAISDKLIFSSIIVAILCGAFALFFGGSAIIEKQEFTTVFLSGSLRLFNVIVLILFITFYIRRAYEAREIEYLLSRPLSPRAFIYSHLIAFAILSIFLSIVVFFTLASIKLLYFQYGLFPLAVWTFTFLIELLLVSTIALFFSMVLSSAVMSVLASLGFYILCRLNGQILGIVDGKTISKGITTDVMEGLSLLIPRLDLIVQPSWILYESQISWGNIALPIFQIIIFVALLSCAALYDLKRKEF